VWTIDNTVPGAGSYSFTATATDLAGNVSGASTALVVTVDTVAPVLHVSGDANGTSYTLPNLPLRPTFAPTDTDGSGVVSSSDSWSTPVNPGATGIYKYTATATDLAGNINGETRTYTVVAKPPSSGAGGGGGGGGGGATVMISISPKSQTIASGGTATFTITASNTGGGYLYAGKVSDGAAPNCSRALETAAEPGLLPPNGGSLTYTCSVSGVRASFTNTITASGLTQNGDTVTTSDSAEVTVTGGAQPVPPATTSPPPTKAIALVRPVIGKAVAVPAKPHAGKALLVSFKINRSDTGAKLTSGKMICDPRIGTRMLKHAEQFTNGTATLRFTLPKTAQGKLLKVHLTIRLGTQSATRIATFHSS
jgi:hypothetical protein